VSIVHLLTLDWKVLETDCFAVHLKGLRYETCEHGRYRSALLFLFYGKERDFIVQIRPWNIIHSYDNTLLASNCRGELRYIRDRTLLVTHDRDELRHIRDRTLLVTHDRGELRHARDWTLLVTHCRCELRHIRDRTLPVTHDRGELSHIRDRTFLAVHCRSESRLTSGTGHCKFLTTEAS
jgi:hypothetical protein